MGSPNSRRQFTHSYGMPSKPSEREVQFMDTLSENSRSSLAKTFTASVTRVFSLLWRTTRSSCHMLEVQYSQTRANRNRENSPCTDEDPPVKGGCYRSLIHFNRSSDLVRFGLPAILFCLPHIFEFQRIRLHTFSKLVNLIARQFIVADEQVTGGNV